TIERIRTAVERLSEFPALGRPGRVEGTRGLVVSGTPYIIPYRIKDDVVQIITILHSAQRWPDRFPEPINARTSRGRGYGAGRRPRPVRAIRRCRDRSA